MDSSCIFCRIIRGEAEAERVYEDEKVLVIRDINPQAPIHLLVLPKKHVASADHVGEDSGIWSYLMKAAAAVARDMGLPEQGYRLVVNCGRRAGQTVPHLHVHLLAGRPFRWPPG